MAAPALRYARRSRTVCAGSRCALGGFRHSEDVDVSQLVVSYDEECRKRAFSREHEFSSHNGVWRMTGRTAAEWDNGVVYSQLSLNAVETAIEREIAHFSRLGHAFEWKLHDYDRPVELGERLQTAGFVARPIETLVVFDLTESIPDSKISGSMISDRVVIERVDDPAHFDVILPVQRAVGSDDAHADWLVASLRAEAEGDPGCLSIHVASVNGEPVSTGWIRTPGGCRFASLWGGSTRRGWRRTGIYSELVRRRLLEARERGFEFVTVDCSDQSLPLLVRRGFRRLATIVPWVWTPPAARDAT